MLLQEPVFWPLRSLPQRCATQNQVKEIEWQTTVVIHLTYALNCQFSQEVRVWTKKMPFTKVVRKIMFNNYLTTDLASKRILLLELDYWTLTVDMCQISIFSNLQACLRGATDRGFFFFTFPAFVRQIRSTAVNFIFFCELRNFNLLNWFLSH